ncbi:MXAN_6640 family putative metalloprotease [Bernardetia sp. Wsw4-3y2]|uniref:MXAN_6640 family putative metalloprotease n=1 Tax=Bernardetia sp. Wsw4-3y2 TaxID=3127471 RepID=UPI0030D3A533
MNFYSTFKTSQLPIWIFVLGFIGLYSISNSSFSQNNNLAEDIEFSKKWEARLNQALSPTHSHTNRGDKSHRSCLSMVLLEGKQNKHKLTERLQKVLRTHAIRPDLDFSVDSRHFRFHYDKTGSNAVSSTDNNNNDIPDYVEFMASEFESVYKKEIEELGYVAPPSDGDEGGGNGFYDIYIQNLQQGYYGAVNYDQKVGDNPNSSVVETEAATSWMEVRNNYDGFGLQNDALKVTAAHEFFHAIQYGYNGSDSPSYFAFEGSASWMEEEIYPRIDDNFQYLDGVFDAPDVAINYNEKDENDPDYFDLRINWYGSWIYFQYIGENYGKEVIRTFWENLRSQSELEALNAALITKGTTLKTACEDYFIANIVLSASSVSQPFTYKRAADYINYLRENTDSERVRVEGQLDYSGQSKVWDSKQQGNRRLMRFSADYIELTTQQRDFKVEITTTEGIGSEIGVQFVALKANGEVEVIKDYPSVGEEAKIEVQDVNQNDKMYLIVYRLGKLNDDFTSKQYKLRIANINEPLGIEDNLGENNYFKIASNPISNNLRFIYQLENQNLKDYKVNITDVLGRKMTQNNSIEKTIPTSKWAKGTYFVTLLYNQKPVAVRKIVVQ